MAGCVKELEQLQEQKNNFNKEIGYFQFLFDELNEAAFKEHELEDLDQELQMLSNAEAINAALAKLNYALQESEQPVVAMLKQMANQLHAFASFNPQIALLIERLQSAQIELLDIARETTHISDGLQYDQNVLTW